MAANSSANGTVLSDKTKFTWPVVIVIVVIAMSFAALGTQQAVHQANTDVHHTTAQLDYDYASKVVVEKQFEEVVRRLDRIEAKLDKLQ